LSLSPRKFGGFFMGVREELESLQERASAMARFLGRFAVGSTKGKGDVLLGGEVREKVALLENKAQAAAIGAKSGFVGRKRSAIDLNGSFIRTLESSQETEEG
jgi:hypothetical protein